MPTYTTLTLNAPSSVKLLTAISKLEEPVDLFFANYSSSVLKVYVDGEETRHELVLNNDCTWRMRTCTEV